MQCDDVFDPLSSLKGGGSECSEFCHSVDLSGNMRQLLSRPKPSCLQWRSPSQSRWQCCSPTMLGAAWSQRPWQAAYAYGCITIFVLLGPAICPAHYDHGTSSSCHIDSHCNQPPKCGEWARLLIARDAKRIKTTQFFATQSWLRNQFEEASEG